TAQRANTASWRSISRRNATNPRANSSSDSSEGSSATSSSTPARNRITGDDTTGGAASTALPSEHFTNGGRRLESRQQDTNTRWGQRIPRPPTDELASVVDRSLSGPTARAGYRACAGRREGPGGPNGAGPGGDSGDSGGRHEGCRKGASGR